MQTLGCLQNHVLEGIRVFPTFLRASAMIRIQAKENARVSLVENTEVHHQNGPFFAQPGHRIFFLQTLLAITSHQPFIFFQVKIWHQLEY